MKLMILLTLFALIPAFGSSFSQEFDITWGRDKAKILNNGQLLTLSLDRVSGSAFQSKHRYLFGKFSMQLKLVHGNSAGTVTSYYVSSEGSTWDEIDFEFLGNLSGEPYTVHTNLISQGRGDREEQFRLWFDPTADFHTYSILWNPKNIIFWVDGTPIRRIRNAGPAAGNLFPTRQPMKVHSSLWNADDWATRGGRVKTDWSQAPFTAEYRNIKMEACAWPGVCSAHQHPWLEQELDAERAKRLVWVRTKHMIYNYCSDTQRFPSGLPHGCAPRGQNLSAN